MIVAEEILRGAMKPLAQDDTASRYERLGNVAISS